MENINLNTPCKIIPSKHKRYSTHYGIPGADSLIIPRKKYGDQISCEVMWKDETGETHRKPDLMFDKTYLEPLNQLKDFTLLGIWENCNEPSLSNQ
jgi:hypothetical protein